jgi:hypothetical protein
MADIELVIKIPEEMWEKIKEGYVPLGISKYLKNGTPLPKGHGDLIDADEIQFENTEFETYGDYCIAFDAIDTATPIIEADKVEGNNKE